MRRGLQSHLPGNLTAFAVLWILQPDLVVSIPTNKLPECALGNIRVSTFTTCLLLPLEIWCATATATKLWSQESLILKKGKLKEGIQILDLEACK